MLKRPTSSNENAEAITQVPEIEMKVKADLIKEGMVEVVPIS